MADIGEGEDLGVADVGASVGTYLVLAALGRLVAPRSKKRLADSWALPWIKLTSMQLARGEVREAAASAMRRTEILAPLPVTVTTGLEVL